MMKKLCFPALLLILAGCATAPPPSAPDVQRRSDFDKAQDSWNGAPLKELIAKLGKPDAVTRQAEGRTVYTFTKGSGGTFSCTVRYTVNNKTQRVQSHQIEGC